MTDEGKRYRISLSRKAYRGKALVNVSAEVDDPQDVEEVARIRADIKSAGWTSIVEALQDRIDDDIEAEIARIQGGRRDRVGLTPVEQPVREKTEDSPPDTPRSHTTRGVRLSNLEQRTAIRAATNTEDQEGGFPVKRNFLLAVMKKEDVDSLVKLSFAGASKILDHFQPVEEKEGFTTPTLSATSPEASYLTEEDIGEVPSIASELTDEELRDEADMDAVSHEQNIADLKRGEGQVVEEAVLTNEEMAVRIEVAKAEAEEMEE